MPNESLSKILIVEDSPDDAELTLGVLAEYDLAHCVVLVEDGADALDYLHHRGRFAGRKDGNPGLLLLDLNVPKVSGLEVLRQMKQHPLLAEIPVVVLSSSGEKRDVRQARALGATAYVVKPVRFDGFVEAVKAIGMFWGILNILRPVRAVSE